MSKPLYTAEQFIKAIPGTAGIITTVAKRVGCQWHTAKKYIFGHPTVLQAYEDECESILDMAEVGLYKDIQDGKEWAIKYILSTKGKKRGYTERTEVTGADGEGIRILVEYVDDKSSDASE